MEANDGDFHKSLILISVGHKNLVQVNDVFFGLHAVAITLFTIFQIFIYERGDQKLSKICIAMCSAMLASIVVVCFVAVGKATTWYV